MIMARRPQEMAMVLTELYKKHDQYRLSISSFKQVAGKVRLREAYLHEVDDYLREDGYVLIDLQAEHGCFAVARQELLLRCEDRSESVGEYIVDDNEADEE
jgi:hypothetical protein